MPHVVYIQIVILLSCCEYLMAMGCFPQASEPLYATIKVSPGMSDLVAEDPWLTLWGQMTLICVSKWSHHWLIIWLLRPPRTNFSDIWIQIKPFSYWKMKLKKSSAKWLPFCFGRKGLMNTMKAWTKKRQKILIEITIKVSPWCVIDEQSALVQVMAWCWKQQAITCTNVDQAPWLHQGPINQLTPWGLKNHGC